MSLSAPTKITIPFANSGTKNTIPNTSQIGITAGLASYPDGFPPLTMTPVASGGVPPFGQDFNGIFYAVTSALQWLQSGAGYAFDGTFSTAVGGYPQYAVVQRSDGQGFWLNTVANNTTGPETSTSSGWLPAASNAATAITMTSSNVTMTALQAGAYIITLSGTLTANLNLVFPTWAQEWLVVNNCTGAFSVTCKTASGTGVAIAAGANAIVYGDGTNIIGLTQTGLAQMQNFTAAVASNALTGTYAPSAPVQFRNATLATGTPVSVTPSSTLTLTIPSGATLGTASGQQSQFAWALVYNGGTPALAVANFTYGIDVSESGLISTTAISSGASAANTWYSTSAISNSPYRIIAITQQTEATAGTYATAPSLVQPVGGEAFTSLGKMQTIILSPTATTSGTSFLFSNIPGWVKRITVLLYGVSLSGSSSLLVQIGSGSIASSGYASGSTAVSVSVSSSTAATTSTAGFVMYTNAASYTLGGTMLIATGGGNLWSESHNGYAGAGSHTAQGGGQVSLSGLIDRINITTVNGTDTFDGGSISLVLEG